MSYSGNNISFTGIMVSLFSNEKIFISPGKPIIKYLSIVFKLIISLRNEVEYTNFLLIKSYIQTFLLLYNSLLSVPTKMDIFNSWE